jgi:uracil-DNA glycosylase
MTITSERLARVARQHIETTRLLGVDFVPVASHARPAAAPSSSNPDKAAALAALRAEHDATCPHCTKATAHTQTVFGDGDPNAALMFVGEAPGAEEDRQGIPFVGASGKKLNEMIKAMGFDRTTVYIANVLKARPPDNATPTPDEAAKCGPFLARQIEIIQPAVIVTLGKPAVSYLLDTRETMTNLRGQWFEYRGIPVMPTFHPAFLLRQYTPENRAKVWSDLKAAVERLKSLGRLPPQ